MDTTEFYKIKQEVLSRPICYRELEAKEIIALGENHYTVGNATFEVEPRVATKIDRFAGIRSEQSTVAHDSYGEQGLTNLRNFFGQAVPRKSKRIVLTADTQSKQIVDATLIHDRMITPEVFFDFAEMFMDKNQYLPDNVEYSMGGNGNISILMKPVIEQFMEFAPGDEFMFNGIQLLWSPGEVSLNGWCALMVKLRLRSIKSQRLSRPKPPNLRRCLTLLSNQSPSRRTLTKCFSAQGWLCVLQLRCMN